MGLLPARSSASAASNNASDLRFAADTPGHALIAVRRSPYDHDPDNGEFDSSRKR
jgi:hypothetical protein